MNVVFVCDDMVCMMRIVVSTRAFGVKKNRDKSGRGAFSMMLG